MGNEELKGKEEPIDIQAAQRRIDSELNIASSKIKR